MTKINRRPDDPTTASALAAHYYVSTEIFQCEIEAIFFRSWQFAGYTFDIKAPGDFFTSTIFDQSIVVVRDRAGEIGAFHNVCAHRGHELVSGRGNALILTCPYHAWSYDLGGKLRAAGNAENVAGFDVAEFSLASIRVETLGPLVFVNLDSKAEPLDSAYCDLLREFRATIPDFDDLRLYRRSEIPVAANWKVIIENGHECYHCPNVHAEFFGADERPQLRIIRSPALFDAYHPRRQRDQAALRFQLARTDRRLVLLDHVAEHDVCYPAGRKQLPGLPNRADGSRRVVRNSR